MFVALATLVFVPVNPVLFLCDLVLSFLFISVLFLLDAASFSLSTIWHCPMLFFQARCLGCFVFEQIFQFVSPIDLGCVNIGGDILYYFECKNVLLIKTLFVLLQHGSDISSLFFDKYSSHSQVCLHDLICLREVNILNFLVIPIVI